MKNFIKSKIKLRYKIMVLICAAILMFVLLTGSIIYYLIQKEMVDLIQTKYVQIINIMKVYIVKLFEGEIADIKTYTSRPLWKNEVERSNLKYEEMDSAAIIKYLLDMDEKWIKSGEDSSLVQEYLNTVISNSILSILELRPNVSEMIITDKYGGLVAASGKTSDFYQADEKWWQEAYNYGKGSVYVSNVEFDDSTGKWCIIISVPIRDENSNVIGVCKESIDLESFLKVLDFVDIGKTGHVVLADGDGNILYHHGIKIMTTKYAKGMDFKNMFNGDADHLNLENPHIHQGSLISFYSNMFLPVMSAKESPWKMFVEQDLSEVYSPIKKFYLSIVYTLIFVLAIIIPIAIIFGLVISDSIKKLNVATDHFIEGDLDYRIDIKTGDEVEELADKFNKMVSALQYKQKELISAKNKIELSASELEGKVSDRTKELMSVNEATLNILEDLSDAKNRLQKALNVKTDFTSMVSHELRTPLTAIKEGIALIADGTSGPINAEQKEFLDIAKRNVDRLARLINDVLDFQKLESGITSFNIQENNINDILAEVKSAMAPLIKERGLDFILNFCEDLPNIKCDRDKIIQVVTNIVNNAVKFTEKGSIEIGSSNKTRYPKMVQVYVKDTGCGISEEDLPKLFQKYTQFGKITDRKGGSGLGLAISMHIIKGHKGEIWAESELGKGSVFYFELPIG